LRPATEGDARCKRPVAHSGEEDHVSAAARSQVERSVAVEIAGSQAGRQRAAGDRGAVLKRAVPIA